MEFNFDDSALKKHNIATDDFFDDENDRSKIKETVISLPHNVPVATKPRSKVSITPNRPAATRRSVAVRESEVELLERPARSRPRITAKAYSKKRSFDIKQFVRNMTWNKAAWMLCAFLFLRLIFMERGVWDYYGQEAHLAQKTTELKSIEKENGLLIEEIHKIKTNDSYQKKMAREHLGVISDDEYMVLFAKDSSYPSH